MSTKIYNGLITNLTMDELADKAQAIRDLIYDVAEDRLVHDFTEYLTSSVVLNKDEKPVIDILAGAVTDFKETDATELVLIKTPEGILGAPVGRDADKLAALLIDQELFREYGYWDNADRPDTVTEDEWSVRKKMWDHVGYGPIYDYGLTIRQEEPNILFIDNDLWRSIVERVVTVGEKISDRVKMNELVKIAIGDDEPSFSHYLDVRRNFGELKDHVTITVDHPFTPGDDWDNLAPIITAECNLTHDELIAIISEV